MLAADRTPTPRPMLPPFPPPPAWQRHLWLGAGLLSVLLGFIGIFLPLLPTTPFILLAAFCFSKGSPRCERWLLQHSRFGPMTREWRARRAVPLRAKQIATAMMAVSSLSCWWILPQPWLWAPGVCCLAVAVWLWRLPTASRAPA